MEKQTSRNIVLLMALSFAIGSVADAADSQLAEAARKSMDGRFRANATQLEKLYGGYHKVRQHMEPTGDLTEALAQLEDAFLNAYAAGDFAEARRLIHESYATLNGEPFRRREAYLASLMLHADRAVIDPTEPLGAELRQLFEAQGPGSRNAMRLEWSLRRAATPRAAPFKKLGQTTLAPISADAPFAMVVELAGVADGAYLLTADLYLADEALRRITRTLTVVTGFAAAEADFKKRLARIEGHASAQATILYPFDFARRLDRNELDAKKFNFPKALAEARRLLESLEAGKGDGRLGAKGDQTRHYVFAEGGNHIMPYRLIVPKGYDAKIPSRLIVTLHGGGGAESTHIGQPGNQIHQLADQYNTIVLAPLGYHNYGGWGRPSSDPARQRDAKLSEADALNAIAHTRDEYNIDPAQIFLMGHSMGANGTWSLVAKYPEKWAAVAPISAGQCTPQGFGEGVVQDRNAAPSYAKELSPYPFGRLDGTPVFITHGARDPRADVANARAMFAAMKSRNMDVSYLENPKGTHAMLQFSLGPIFKFFDDVARR